MRKIRKPQAVRLAAGAACALLALWRLPDVLTLPEPLWARAALYAALFAAFTAVMAFAFTCADKRLKKTAYPLGFLLAVFLLLGKPMRDQHALPSATPAAVAGFALSLAVFTVLLGALALLTYRGVLVWLGRPQKTAPSLRGEPLLGRLTGNWLVVFGVMLLCWVPVWLAFYPGTFRYDADTQFYTYVDGTMTTFHPLLHTLLLGWLLNWGNDLDSLTLGVAMYDGLQLVLMAAIVAYAFVWLRKRGAPLGLRIFMLALFALLPLYPLWAFSATKDVLFGGLVLLTCLQMADLWRDGKAWFRSPLRITAFVLTAVLMMLLRNNGVYAFCLALPFAVAAARGRRGRTLLLLATCVVGYLGTNQLLVNLCDAGGGSYVEMLSVPLQQTMRVATRRALSDEDKELLSALFWEYDGDWTTLYIPTCSDNVKWNLDSDTLSADWQSYLSLWWRLGIQNPRLYLEAFLEQNLPYFYPGQTVAHNIMLGLLPIDLYTLEEHSQLPQLKPFYQQYDQTLTVFGLPFTELFADSAWMGWGALWLLGLFIYRRKWGGATAAVFLLAIWVTCLLGPIAAMRYMLGLFYTVPVLFAWAFARDPHKPASAVDRA